MGQFKGVIDSGRGATRADDAQGTPTQSYMSPSILVHEDNEQSPSTPQRRGRREPLYKEEVQESCFTLSLSGHFKRDILKTQRAETLAIERVTDR